MKRRKTKRRQFIVEANDPMVALANSLPGSVPDSHVTGIQPIGAGTIMTIDPLPSVLTTEEFAYLSRHNREVIRQKIRARVIEAFGRPYRIPCRELLKYGVDLGDAARLLHRRAQDARHAEVARLQTLRETHDALAREAQAKVTPISAPANPSDSAPAAANDSAQ